MKFLNTNNRIFFKNLKAKIPFLVVVFAFIFYINYAQSAFNEQINYQGKLTDSTGQAIADGDYNIEFKLYTASTGGSPVWTETCDDTDKITVTNGLFSHLLGSVTALDDSIFNQDLYLSVNVGGTGTPSWDGEMTPRKKLGSVASAFEAKRLAGKLESEFGDTSETETITGLWTFSATTTMATTTITSSTITTLYAGSLNVNGTSSTLWDQAYNYFNASSTNLNTTHFIVNSSSTNWDWTHDYVNASSTNWDIAYVKGLNAYSYAHATATENVAGLEFSDQQLNLTTGYEIPTTASTTDWTSTSVALNLNDGNWTYAYGLAHATATESITGLEFSGQDLQLTTGYEIPTTVSTTDWTSSSVALNLNDAKWTEAYSYAHATATESITGIDLTGQAFSLTDGYVIPLSASTTEWANAYNRIYGGTMTDTKYCTYDSATGKISCNSEGGTAGISSLAGQTGATQLIATGTKPTGLDFKVVSSGDTHTFNLTIDADYNIPLTASTTNWNTAYDTVNASSTNWDWTHNYVNSSSTNLDTTHFIVNSSSTYWDTAYNMLTGTMTDTKYCTYDSATGKISCNSEGGSGGTPGGNNGELQFKNGTDFAGDSNLVWSSSTGQLLIGNSPSASEQNIITSSSIALNVIGISKGGIEIFGTSSNISLYYDDTFGDGDASIEFYGGSYGTNWRIRAFQDQYFEMGGIYRKINNLIGIFNDSPIATLDILSSSTDPIFQVQASTTKPAMYVANKGQVGIGTTTPTLALSIEGGLQLGPTTTAPTTINGTMYYDASTNKFKCYQNGGWTDCIGGSPGGSDSYVQYNNSGALGGERYFVYDDTNRRLGIGTSTPTSTLEIYSSTTNPILSISGGENSALDPAIRLSVGSGMPLPKIKIGYDTSDTDFRIVKGDDLTVAANVGLEINDSLNVGIGTSSRSSYALNTVTGFFETGISVNYLFSVQHDGTAAKVTMSGVGSVFNIAGDSSLFQINGNINYGGTLNNYYPDLAEKFPTQDIQIEPGDVVAIDAFNKENIVKTSSEYQEDAMGVVSTQPGIIMGGLIIGNGRDVALAGRIPVKVNLNNGDIKAGDYLTSSDIPGIAMKATKAGKVLGMAMENYTQANQNDGQKTIIMFVEPHYVGNDLEYVQTASGNIVSQTEITLENIKTKLADIGIIVNANGYLEATTIKSKRMETEEIELTDKSTGEIYCIWYQNGVRQEQKGRCEDIFGTSDIPAEVGNDNSVIDENTTTSEIVENDGSGITEDTTGVESSETDQTNESSLEQTNSEMIESDDQSSEPAQEQEQESQVELENQEQNDSVGESILDDSFIETPSQ